MKERRTIIISAALVLIACGLYEQVRHFGFVRYDDPLYVTENRWVRQGITAEGAVRAATVPIASNWHPLTILSLMLDVSLFGVDPGAHHLVNVLFHAANGVLLFLVLNLATGAAWRSAMVAALFVVHPLHVESVAWISERKDVLSTLFGLLAIRAYLGYVRTPGARRYAGVAAFLALSLMSKPMLVTLPFLLLVLDYWPLGRFGREGIVPGKPFFRIAAEKLPLLALSAASCLMTFWAQKGAVLEVAWVPVWARLGNAVTSYVRYIIMTVHPVSLTAFYPHPALAQSAWAIAGSALAIGLASYASIRYSAGKEYLPAGWFWYVGTLVPVIGVVQVGSQAMADRYTYFPLIGLFIAAVWGGCDAWQRLRLPGKGLALVGGLIVAVLAVMAWQQVGYWRSNRTLFEHMVAVAPRNNRLAHVGLADSYVSAGDVERALGHYVKVLEVKPDDAYANGGLGDISLMKGKPAEAAGYFRRALAADPNLLHARYALGIALINQGQTESGYEQIRKVAESDMVDDPRVPLAQGMLLVRRGQLDEGIAKFRESLAASPGDPYVLARLGLALAKGGRLEEARAAFGEEIRMTPADAAAWYNLGLVLEQEGRIAEAIPMYERAAALNPSDPAILGNLGGALGKTGRIDEARKVLREAVRIDPKNEVARHNLEIVSGLTGKKAN